MVLEKDQQPQGHLEITLPDLESNQRLKDFLQTDRDALERKTHEINLAIYGLGFRYHGLEVTKAHITANRELSCENEEGQLILIAHGEEIPFLETMHSLTRHTDIPLPPFEETPTLDAQTGTTDLLDKVRAGQRTFQEHAAYIDKINLYLKGMKFTHKGETVQNAYFNFTKTVTAEDKTGTIVSIPPVEEAEFYDNVVLTAETPENLEPDTAGPEEKPSSPPEHFREYLPDEGATGPVNGQESVQGGVSHEQYREFLPSEDLQPPSEIRPEPPLEVRLPSLHASARELKDDSSIEANLTRINAWNTQFRENAERSIRRFYGRTALAILNFEYLGERHGYDDNEYAVTVRFGGTGKSGSVGSGADIQKIIVTGIMMDAGDTL